MTRAVVIECNRRCGTRFVRESIDGESERVARSNTVWAAEGAGWREMRARGLRCAGCFARYGYGNVRLDVEPCALCGAAGEVTP